MQKPGAQTPAEVTREITGNGNLLDVSLRYNFGLQIVLCVWGVLLSTAFTGLIWKGSGISSVQLLVLWHVIGVSGLLGISFLIFHWHRSNAPCNLNYSLYVEVKSYFISWRLTSHSSPQGALLLVQVKKSGIKCSFSVLVPVQLAAIMSRTWKSIRWCDCYLLQYV